MPIYEYKCKECGHVFDKLMKHKDPIPPCPASVEANNETILESCGGETERLISKTSFILKGKGWAKDGYG